MPLKDQSTLQGGKYRIVRFISSGGFGCTYEAFHVMLDKRVAIKEFFVEDFCNRDEETSHVSVGTSSKRGLVEKLKSKFIDEAKALCQLSHPGIVHVFDVFEENGTAYFVMDYVDGKSLKDILNESGPMTEFRAKGYIAQVCKALGYVHGKNRLHLDIKPGNIMVDRNNRAVLIDFGASKQYDEDSGENTSTILGMTPGYAPPEQMSNEIVRFYPSTDIYSLGATFHSLLTGEVPPSATKRIAGDELTEYPPEITAETRNAINKALELNKKYRPQSIDEFERLLEKSEEIVEVEVEEEPEPVPPVPHTRETSIYSVEETVDDKGKKKKIILFSALGVLAVILVLGIIGVSSGSDSKEGELVAVEDTLAVTDEKAEAKTAENVTDKTFTIYGMTFSYTGPVNANGLPEGKGKGVFDDGVYEGGFKDGIRDGEATFTTTDGSNTFKGTFKAGNYEKGRLYYDDKTYFEGTFKDNQFYDGKYYSADGVAQVNYVKGESK